MTAKNDHYFAQNRRVWDSRIASHRDSDFYDLDGFMAGKNVLKDIERSELGNVKGKKLLHLQCHFGLDTLSWSRLGAMATGIDFSSEAITEAKKINLEAGLDARFICSNVYDLKNHLDGKFDIVFTSYGVIGWLPDLSKWADIVQCFLKPGGVFYMVEFHPFVWMLDSDFKHIHYSYFNDGVIEEELEGSYADRGKGGKHIEYSWNHSISEVLNALIKKGLTLEFMNEYDYSPYDCFPNTVKREDGNFYIEGYESILPMIYSIKLTK